MSVSHHATPSTSALAEVLGSETWYVTTASGVSVLTLHDLERALASGEIDATTPVWIPGMAEWEALGHVANLEDGPPVSQGPGVPPPYDSRRAPGSASVRPPARNEIVEGPLSRALAEGDPSDPNGALWASTLPRPAQVLQSGIWRRPKPEVAASEAAPAQRRWLLRAAILTGLLLLLLAAWRERASSVGRSEGRVPSMAVGS